MGHADFALSRDSIEGMDDMAALCDTMTQAVRSAQRAYDNRTDERGAHDELREARALITQGVARVEAEHAMEAALYGSEPVATMRSNEGMHTPATLVSTLLGADDAEVNDLMLAALRAACAVDRGRPRHMCDAEAGAALRQMADVLCVRFGAEHSSAYVGGAL